MRYFFRFIWLIILTSAFNINADIQEVRKLIDQGHFREAHLQIAQLLQNESELSYSQKSELEFEKDRMRRIALDFRLPPEKAFKQALQIDPTITPQDFEKWEKAGSLEFMIIDGEKKYFNNAVQNLFRVNSEAKMRKQKLKPELNLMDDTLRPNRQAIIAGFSRTGNPLQDPQRFEVVYTLSIKPGEVPTGEIARAWLPYPQETDRQKDICLVQSDPKQVIIADQQRSPRTVYMEKVSKANEAVTFSVTFQYTSFGQYQIIDPNKIDPTRIDDSIKAQYLCERAPHIQFTPNICALSSKIIGKESNLYLKAKKIFRWISDNVIWASAREYSTHTDIPGYILAHGWGDCGMKAMLFITLCRYNGIPARWESGFTSDAVYHGMHDWAQIYLPPYGWLPVDPDQGYMADEKTDAEKWFNFGNIDSYRLVINHEFSAPLYPAKIFFRSETVDFQRGEVESRAGNLYFDQWDWDYSVKRIELSEPGNSK